LKPLRKAILLLVAVIVAVQVPFIYRRYRTGRRAAAIAEIQQNRIARVDPKYREYRGIIHAHTSLGGHSTGSFAELIPAAAQNGLDFVLMTEHWSDELDTSALTLNGVYGKTLFVGGNEIDTADSDRFLMVPGSADAPGLRRSPTVDVLKKLNDEHRVGLITYPEKFKSWESDFNGVEVMSLHTEATHMNIFVALEDLLWSGTKYPQLTFAQQIRRPVENIRRFDESAARRPIGLFFGTDAHSNIGIHLLGDDAGHKLINLKVDSYRSMFGVAQMRILLEAGVPLTRESLVSAVFANHYYAAMTAFGDPDGFRFDAGSTASAIVGDETPMGPDLVLRAAAPTAARFVVYKNGEKFAEQSGVAEYTFRPDGPGAYRVEAYLDELGLESDRMPWIMSNPIYVR
jgi:hypothetical protein